MHVMRKKLEKYTKQKKKKKKNEQKRIEEKKRKKGIMKLSVKKRVW